MRLLKEKRNKPMGNIEKHKEAMTLYELINIRIKEIEDEMLKSDSTLTDRHLQKSLDFNRMILGSILSRDSHRGHCH